MLTIIWKVIHFHVVDLMTEQHSYNIEYFLSDIMELLLLAIFPDGRKLHSRQLDVHLDKCRIHCLKAFDAFLAEKQAVRVSRPPYIVG
jgi:hypothetical protein